MDPNVHPPLPLTRSELVIKLIREDYELIDPKIPHYLSLLSQNGADLCWHKHSTFKQHLYQVWKILTIWRQPIAITRCGLFHSAYSNSYVNLAIFNSSVQREMLQELIGTDAEDWVYRFCTVHRYDVVYNTLLNLDKVPHEGLTVKHIKTGEPVHLSRKNLGIILVMTMADFADQNFSWQDKLFENDDGKLLWKGDNPATLWPGDGMPGRWMSNLSKMGLLAKGCEDEGVILPEVFDKCTKFLSEEDEKIARDKYIEVSLHRTEKSDQPQAEILLNEVIKHNPFIAEPHVLLAQILSSQDRYQEAHVHAEAAMTLLEQWGTCWDKRMSWEAWVAWTRQLIQASKKENWPKKAWGLISIGFVDRD